MAAFGMRPDQIDEALPKRKSSFEVFPENWTALQVFLLCATQWRVTHEGAQGIEYGSLEAVMRIHRIKDRADCFERAQIMEFAALKEFKRRQKR